FEHAFDVPDQHGADDSRIVCYQDARLDVDISGGMCDHTHIIRSCYFAHRIHPSKHTCKQQILTVLHDSLTVYQSIPFCFAKMTILRHPIRLKTLAPACVLAIGACLASAAYSAEYPPEDSSPPNTTRSKLQDITDRASELAMRAMSMIGI